MAPEFDEIPWYFPAKQGIRPQKTRSNRVDRRTLEGQQLVDELTAFGEHVSPPIGDRSVFVRAFAAGFPISAWAGKLAHGEIQTLTDLVERFLRLTPAEAR